MGWNGFKQGAEMSPVVNISTDSGATWNNISVPDVPSTASAGSLSYSRAMAASDTDIMVPLTLTYHSAPVLPYETKYQIILMISRDEGLTWETHFEVTPAGINSGSPYLAIDGNGKWFLYWFGYSEPDFSDVAIYVQTSSDAGLNWSAPTVIRTNSEPIVSAATDGQGRWIVVLNTYPPGSQIQYLWSDDNGLTWSSLQSISGSKTAQEGNQVVFMGDGMWGITWADGFEVKISRLQWGPSAVHDWDLY
jgi:hypothetical protein